MDWYSILQNVDCDKPWSLKDFEIGKKIRTGQYGKVYIVKENRTSAGLLFTLKVINMENVIKDKCEENITREIIIHKKLKHPNIVQFHAHFFDNKFLYFVMEFGGDSLYLKMYDENKKFCLKERDAAKYAKQVTEALIYIHSQGYAHRDLKPDNILISYSDDVKITDFGWLEKKVTDQDQEVVELNKSMTDTLAYLCPEMFRGCDHDGFKVDTWCLGVLIYEMVFGKVPFQDSDRRRDQLDFPYPIDTDCAELISALLKTKPEKRIDLNDALHYNWLTRFNSQKKIA